VKARPNPYTRATEGQDERDPKRPKRGKEKKKSGRVGTEKNVWGRLVGPATGNLAFNRIFIIFFLAKDRFLARIQPKSNEIEA
jgi:hypothetical protein